VSEVKRTFVIELYSLVSTSMEVTPSSWSRMLVTFSHYPPIFVMKKWLPCYALAS
jgi:hypothetical protein